MMPCVIAEGFTSLSNLVSVSFFYFRVFYTHYSEITSFISCLWSIFCWYIRKNGITFREGKKKTLQTSFPVVLLFVRLPQIFVSVQNFYKRISNVTSLFIDIYFFRLIVKKEFYLDYFSLYCYSFLTQIAYENSVCSVSIQTTIFYTPHLLKSTSVLHFTVEQISL